MSDAKVNKNIKINRHLLFALFLYECFMSLHISPFHRRSIKTEEKAKVVPAVWGADSIHFFAALAFLYLDDLKNRLNSSFSSKWS